MDAKGLLMKTRRMEIFTQKSADAVVKAILGETPVSSYISGKEIDSCKEEEVPLRSHMMTDYDLIVEQAQKQGFEFLYLAGKSIFSQETESNIHDPDAVAGTGDPESQAVFVRAAAGEEDRDPVH